jgi:GT2 family glycosyltransferase
VNNAPAALVKQVLGADGLQGGVPHWQALSPKPDTSNLAQPAVWESNTLSIVIVNWNSGPLLRACLDSIAAHRSELQEDLFLERLIVVENASTDDSATSLDYPELPLLILRNSANLGFAAACNQGARACGGEVILFLNPDAKLQRGSLRAPLELLASPAAQRVGMVGVQIVMTGEK